MTLMAADEPGPNGHWQGRKGWKVPAPGVGACPSSTRSVSCRRLRHRGANFAIVPAGIRCYNEGPWLSAPWSLGGLVKEMVPDGKGQQTES
jgi:hypothetical protein